MSSAPGHVSDLFSGGHRGVLIVKRKGRPDSAEEWFAIMPAGKFLDLMTGA